jgi:hypothetical protein
MIRMILLGIGVVACAHQAPSLGTGAGDGADRLTMEVASQRVPCIGEARTRCLRVRVVPDTTWTLFYDRIEGFAFEEGYRWRLDVERRRVSNPPADGSSFSYRLVRVVSRERDRL